MNSLELSSSVFSILSSLIEERTGLHYGPLDRDLLRDKASARALEAGFNSLLDYYYFLRYDLEGENEFTELTESLVVNETYFFREWASIQMLVECFIAPICATGRKPRIWSAACSTGEEPLSLAMLLHSRGLLNQVEITASDVSARVLAKAQSGVFGKRSVRSVPDPELCERYVTFDKDRYVVQPDLISAIRWRRLNLLQFADIGDLGVFDVIICRNVLIYFSDATIKRLLGVLSRALDREGALIVGVSESLMRYGSLFIAEERSGAFAYRKVKTP